MMPLLAVTILLFAPLSAASAPTGSAQCTTAKDCELLGECVSGACQCFPGFAGPSCAQIDLEPAPSPLPAWPVRVAVHVLCQPQSGRRQQAPPWQGEVFAMGGLI